MTFSRFYLCDLQVHTPADRQQRYGDVGGPAPNKKFAQTLMRAHADAGVEVIAVTDHNRVDWYPLLRTVGDEVGVAVFPGLEFSVNGCHLLTIWDRNDKGYDCAQRFLHALWRPSTSMFEGNGDPKPVSSGQVMDIAKLAHDHMALVLAPHTTAKGIGLFAKGVCRNSREVCQSGLIAGFDVAGSSQADVLTNPRAEFGNSVPPWFVSGDTRSIEEIGQRAAYLKLGGEPTLEGLRQAFLMPHTRVRFPSRLQESWGHVAGVRFLANPKPGWPRITSVAIRGGFHSQMDVPVAPGLTAVIGGKGTGKSTFIEILRYSLEAGRPLTTEAEGNRKQNFRANAEAVIGFADASGDAYEVVRSGDDTRARLRRGGRDTDVEVRRRVGVRVFGQRELQELGKRRDLLREFVASQVGAPWEVACAKEQELLDHLRTGEGLLGELEASLARMNEYTAELRDIKDRLAVAEEKGVAKLIGQVGALATADRAVRRALEWPSKVASATDGLRATTPAPKVPEDPRIPGEIAQVINDLEQRVIAGAAELRNEAVEASAALRTPRELWVAAQASEKHRLQSALAEAGITDPGELDAMQTRGAELEGLVSAQGEQDARRQDAAALRRSLLNRLQEVRREKSRLVEEAVRALTQRVGPRVRLVVTPFGDRSLVADLLDEALKGQAVRREQTQRICDKAPMVVADAIRSGVAAVEALGCSSSTAAKLVALPTATVRAIERVDTPDRIAVEIDLGSSGAESWMNVETVSPGQRATALLALALASGSEPLIIDQPEDDLDNRYIYSDVVNVLNSVCEGRQVIVATHNANIPILGDAELVLALDADAGRSRVLACGGLEMPAVAEEARRILEGGDEAFKARHRRYLAAGS